MGHHLRLPPHVNGFRDRYSKTRFYLRRPGYKSVLLPGLPWSPPFMSAYEAALNGQAVAVLAIAGEKDVVPRSIRSLAASYYQSRDFKSLKPITQGVYRNIVDKFCREKFSDGTLYGDWSAVKLERSHIEKMMTARMEQPESANGLRKVLRAMMKHAVSEGWRKDDPTQGVAKVKPTNIEGFHCWTEEEILQFETFYPVGTKPRLAMALGLYFGQARQDVVMMGEQHIKNGALNWVRGKTATKTGLKLTIPVLPELRAIIDAAPSGHLNFLVTEFGKPFTVAGFGNWFRDRCNDAGMPARCGFHGLRKAAATRLADAGCDVMEIAAITGHASLKVLQRYIEQRNRERAAARAMSKLSGNSGGSNPAQGATPASTKPEQGLTNFSREFVKTTTKASKIK